MATWISVVNQTTSLSDTDVFRFATALHAQVNGEFSDAWDLNAIILAGKAPPDSRTLLLRDRPVRPQDAGILGRHDTAHGGVAPQGVIFVELCRAWKEEWTVAASHEALEMLVDPQLNRYVEQDGLFWAQEVCDPVQGSSYEIQGVAVSNFVLPSYYVPDHYVNRYDHLGLLTKPFGVIPTGHVTRYQDRVVQSLYGVNVSPERREIQPGSRRYARLKGTSP